MIPQPFSGGQPLPYMLKPVPGVLSALTGQVSPGEPQDLSTGATVDRYLADQLIFYAALADGVSLYRIPRLTEHVETNLWLVETILGARTEVDKNLVKIQGIGYHS